MKRWMMCSAHRYIPSHNPPMNHSTSNSFVVRLQEVSYPYHLPDSPSNRQQ